MWNTLWPLVLSLLWILIPVLCGPVVHRLRSLQTYDITTLLASPVYQPNSEHIRTHRDYLTISNPSIAPINASAGLFLVEYRYYVEMFVSKSFRAMQRLEARGYHKDINLTEQEISHFRRTFYDEQGDYPTKWEKLHQCKWRRRSRYHGRIFDNRPEIMDVLHPSYNLSRHRIMPWNSRAFNGACFAILQIFENRSINVTYNRCEVGYELRHRNGTTSSMQNFVGDERLVKIAVARHPETQSNLHYFAITGDRDKSTSMQSYLLTLNMTDPKSPTFWLEIPPRQTTPTLCVNSWFRTIHMPYGKNWALFPLQNTSAPFEMLQQLLPTYVVKQTTKNDCVVSTPPLNKTIDKFFTFDPRGRYQFSLGTPLVNFGRRTLLGVGHSRFKYPHVDDPVSVAEDTPNWRRFVTHLGRTNYTQVSINVYFMYFYTLDTQTRELTQLSHSFLVRPHMPYYLQFPIGLCEGVRKNHFLISYGDADFKAKIMEISRRDIRSLLHPADRMTRSAHAHDFQFLESK